MCEISDAAGDTRDVPLGTTAGRGGHDLSAPLTGVSFPIRVRALTISPVDIGVAGDVAVRNLRTDSGQRHRVVRHRGRLVGGSLRTQPSGAAR